MENDGGEDSRCESSPQASSIIWKSDLLNVLKCVVFFGGECVFGSLIGCRKC